MAKKEQNKGGYTKGGFILGIILIVFDVSTPQAEIFGGFTIGPISPKNVETEVTSTPPGGGGVSGIFEDIRKKLGI